MDYEMLNFTL